MRLKLIRISTIWGLLLALGAIASAHSANENKMVEVPFSLDSGVIVLQVKIHGKGPYNIVLATGYPTSKLSTATFNELKLPIRYNIADDPIGGHFVTWISVPDIQIGDLKVDVLNMNAGELANMSQRLGITVDGVLGCNFLKGRVVQIDYPKKVIRFMQTAPAPPVVTQQTASSTSLLTNYALLPMKFAPEEPVTVVDELYVNDKKLKALLDTNQSGTLALTPAALKYLGLPVPAKKNPSSTGTVAGLKIGPMPLGATEALFFAKGTSIDHDLDKYGAIIGNNLMSNYVVTLDYQHHTVMFMLP